MILQSYYLVKKTSIIDYGAKARMSCILSTGDYEPFEKQRDKIDLLRTYLREIRPYINPQSAKLNFGFVKNRLHSHITTIEDFDPTKSYWIGNVIHTNDTILFHKKNFVIIDGEIGMGSELEIFIAPGTSSERGAILEMACKGRLNPEMDSLRKKCRVAEFWK